MSNCIKRVCLFLFYIAALFIIGCIPEDSLEWSEDGSVGLLCVDGALYLVDGQTGVLTEIAKDDVQPWPDISKDGSLIIYSRKMDVNDLSEGLKMLPAGQARMIEYCGKQMREDIIKAGGLTNDRFPEPSLETLKDDEVQNWVIRYSFENADEKLINVLGEKGIKLGKEKTLSYYKVIAVPRNNLNNKRVIAASIFPIMMTRLSPDKKHTAYVMNVQYEGEDMELSLYTASLEGEVKNVLINQCVSLGYDWSEDSKKIAYLSANSSNFGNDDLVLGSLDEIEVADANGTLLYGKPDISEQGLVHTYDCIGSKQSLAGIAFYPWMKVRYETGGRIFFSTIKMSLPTGNMNDPGYSIFCYDPVIGSVTEIMPSEAFAYAGQALAMMQFELSPNGKDVLVPIKKNRFIGFTLGAKEADMPFAEDEGFGDDDVSKLLPVFKGNNEISFLVSEDNHFLAEAGQSAEKKRYEIIVLNRDNGKSRILSKSWPDEIMNALSN